MELVFQGQSAVVTGGASGIGSAVALALARAGARVVIADLADAGDALATTWRAEGLDVTYARTDVSRWEDCERLQDLIDQDHGRVDVLVNSAGIFPRGTLFDTDDGLWNRVLDVNLKGVFHTAKALVPFMMSGGGAIVNVGSVNVFGGDSRLMAYTASKGGVVSLTLNLARALARHHIRVNCVHPGWVVTEGERAVQRELGMPDDWPERMGKQMPFGRLLVPSDIAPTVLFLASRHASQITGQVIAVDGGALLR